MPSAELDAANGTVLRCTAGGANFAVPAEHVREIIRPGALARLPLGPPCLLGLMALRGAALPVISLAGFLGQAGRQAAPVGAAAARIVVLEHPDNVGILVESMPALAPAKGHQVLHLETILADAFGQARGTPAGGRTRSEQATRRADHAPAPAGEKSFIGFELAGQDYALPLGDVQDVMALPPDIASLPGSADGMAGLTEWRGALLPLVYLRVLLGLPDAAPGARWSRIVVARLGGHSLGLVVDRMGEILRMPESAIDQVPPVLTRARGEARIQGVCRARNGRLVALLSPAALFDAETTERLLAAGGAAASRQDGAGEAGERFVAFRLGGEEYAVPISCVGEVVRRPGSVTPVPRGPGFLDGLINLRGGAVPLIDQKKRFGVPPAAREAGSYVVVVTAGGQQAGLSVDGVPSVLDVAHGELAAAPARSGLGSPVIDRVACIERGGRTIMLVDPGALLRDAARAMPRSFADAGTAIHA